MAAVTVSRSDERLIAVKQAPAERAESLEREAELLRRLDHPGLVRFVDLVETPDGGRALHTEFVNADTWATRPLSDPVERAAGMAALAAVVADLHQLGVAHLQLTGPHVLHGVDDRPVLCGLTRADEATTENCRRDLAALAELCHDSSLGKSALSGKLLAVADAARGGLIGAREMARRLDLLAARKPAKKTRPAPGPGQGDETAAVRAAGPGSERLSLRTRRLLIAGAVGLAIVGGFALGSRSATTDWPATSQTSQETVQLEAAENAEAAEKSEKSENAEKTEKSEKSQDAEDSADAAFNVSSDDTSSGASAIGSETPEEPAAPEAQAAPEAPEKPAAPAASLRQAAALLTHGGRRFALGVSGDFVEIGDWDCDGTATAAIVRPGSGGIALFDDWPEPGETLALPQRWRIDSPTGAEAVADGECDLLRVYTTNGSKLFDPAGEADLFTVTQVAER